MVRWHIIRHTRINPLSANFPKRSNTPKQFIDKLCTNCLSVFDHFVGMALKELKNFVAQDSVLKCNTRLSFYYRYLVEVMAWHKPCGFYALNTIFWVIWKYSLVEKKIKQKIMKQIWSNKSTCLKKLIESFQRSIIKIWK